jgi:hypothetical protein
MGDTADSLMKTYQSFYSGPTFINYEQNRIQNFESILTMAANRLDMLTIEAADIMLFSFISSFIYNV